MVSRQFPSPSYNVAPGDLQRKNHNRSWFQRPSERMDLGRLVSMRGFGSARTGKGIRRALLQVHGLSKVCQGIRAAFIHKQHLGTTKSLSSWSKTAISSGVEREILRICEPALWRQPFIRLERRSTRTFLKKGQEQARHGAHVPYTDDVENVWLSICRSAYSNLDHGERIVAKLTSEIGAETTAELLQSLANKANGSQPSGEQGVVDVDSDDDDAEDEPFERQAPAAVRQLPQDEQEEQEVFSQLCAMLRNIYFQREHQLLASYTPDKEALWKTVRKIEDDFAAKAQEIKDEPLIAFGKSDWSSNQPHLTNPR